MSRAPRLAAIRASTATIVGTGVAFAAGLTVTCAQSATAGAVLTWPYREARTLTELEGLTRTETELAERDPALAQLAGVAVSGLAPAGPELRRRPALVAFDGRPGVVISAPLSVREAGFSLHAATRAEAADEQGREALLKYDPWKSPTGDVLRTPLATEPLLPGLDGLVRIALKKASGATTNAAAGPAAAGAPGGPFLR